MGDPWRGVAIANFSSYYFYNTYVTCKDIKIYIIIILHINALNNKQTFMFLFRIETIYMYLYLETTMHAVYNEYNMQKI